MPILKRPDTTLYFERLGAGPPVVMIHGIGVIGRAWQPQVVELQNRFSTLTFDNRGLGRSLPCSGPIAIDSMAEDVLALMDESGWPSAHIVGHSLGGVVAQQVALTNPKRVRSLSLLCTFASGRAGARPTPRVLWMSLRTHLGTRRMRQNAFLEMLLTPEEIQTGGRDHLVEMITPLIGRDLATTPPIMMKQLRALGRHHALPKLRLLGETPTLVISAEEDPIALPRFGRQLAENIPGARFELMKQASHGVVLTQAQVINSYLIDFISRHEQLT